MFVLSNLIAALAQLLSALFTIYTWILIIRVLISWVSPDPFNPVVQFLIKASDPVLEPLRRVIPSIGPLDISPVVAILVLQAFQHFVIRTLMDVSIRLR